MKYILAFLLLFNIVAYAQENYSLKIKFLGEEEVGKLVQYQRSLTDSASIFRETNWVLAQLQAHGYLLAEVTSFEVSARHAAITVQTGTPYQLIGLTGGNVAKEVQQTVGFKESDFRQRTFSRKKLEGLFERLLHYYEDNGYPFASIAISNLKLGEKGVEGALNVSLFERIVYDSLILVGNAKLNPKFIQTYLKVKKNGNYSESKVLEINKRLQELPYLKPVKQPTVAFSNGKSKISIFADQRNANQFDGILGLQQNGEGGQTQLVGNLKLRLQNSFGRGELLQLNYQGLANQSQLLDLAADIPNILATDFGIGPGLVIYKQDTSFVNLDTRLNVSYSLSGYNTIKFFIDNRSTSLVAVNAYANSQVLPAVLDANTTLYGLGLSFENLDYRYNPRKGHAVNLEASVGKRTIKRNNALNPTLYDGLALSSTAYRLLGKAAAYTPLAARWVLALNNETGILSAKNRIENELFRIGGQRSLRGFNEFAILASAYTLGNIEFRYLLAERSYFFAFYNQAYVQMNTSKASNEDFPLGFGGGINLETNIGIISLAYALGKQQNNPINLRQGKIHFGLIALF